MFLSHILFPQDVKNDFSDCEIGKPMMDSRRLSKKDVFFSENGASYMKEALEKGAAAIVTSETAVLPPCPVPVFRVENVRKNYALAWQRYTGHPERALRLFAVTGTNGKTSVARFLASLFEAAGCKVGRLGTVEYFDGKDSYPSEYTTPPPELLYPIFMRMKENGVTHVVLEASSHAIVQERLAHLTFDAAIFTNLTHDHLDYHKTPEAYRNAKATLFRSAKISILNGDDPNAREMAWRAAGDVYYYGASSASEFVISEPQATANGISYTLGFGGECLFVKAPLVGAFHIQNTAAAIAATLLSGVPAETAKSAAGAFSAPKGRLELLPTDTPYRVYLDYAHTPDALSRSLQSLRPFTKKLTVLFGAGGDRDREKRPEMGKAADELADRIILTSDNPRSEDPLAIMEEIQAGIRSQVPDIIPDRKEAIEYALSTAEKDEIILLAGKGHETYIIDKNGKHHFSERQVVQNYLERKGQENVSQHE